MIHRFREAGKHKKTEREFFTFVLVISVGSHHRGKSAVSVLAVRLLVWGFRGCTSLFMDNMLSKSLYAHRENEIGGRNCRSLLPGAPRNWITLSHVTNRVASISSHALMHLSVSDHPGDLFLLASLQTCCFGVQVAFTDLLLQV